MGAVDVTASARDEDLHLVLPDAGVPLSRMLNAQQTFYDLIREVGANVAGERGVIWVVVGVEKGSYDLAVRPVASKPELPVTMLPQISRTITRGLDTLVQRAERPPHFTDKALMLAKELATLVDDDMPTLTVRTTESAARVSKPLPAYVDLVLGEPIVAKGSVEGRLESLTVHDRRAFSIYDPLTGERIECTFGVTVAAADIGQAVEKRVRVHGDIRYRDNGDIVSVRAQEFEILPDPASLPSADEVRGILSA